MSKLCEDCGKNYVRKTNGKRAAKFCDDCLREHSKSWSRRYRERGKSSGYRTRDGYIDYTQEMSDRVWRYMAENDVPSFKKLGLRTPSGRCPLAQTEARLRDFGRATILRDIWGEFEKMDTLDPSTPDATDKERG